MGCCDGDTGIISRLGGAAGGIVHGAIANGKLALGIDLAPQQLVSSRLMQCLACEHREPKSSHCRKCGCPVHRKVRLQGEVCPVGTW